MQAIFHIKNRFGKADEHITLHQSLIFGRGKEANISITDNLISSKHCQITFKSDRLEIIDLGSKNGTYLNGIRIEQSEIFLGDEIRIGQTTLVFNEALMSTDALKLLSFPGPFKERINYELKADFTGARVQNLLYLKEHPGEINSAYQAREIAFRRKAHSKIKLSKEEIRSNNRLLAMMSLLIDFLLLLGMIFLPIYLINNVAQAEQAKTILWNVPASFVSQNKELLIVVLEIFLISLYMICNTRLMKFTIGEKIAGIEDIYARQ